jgi:predicted Zn-dependent peptidase
MKRAHSLTILLILVVLLLPLTIDAQSIEDRVTEHTLSNGFKVLMLERHTAPTAALYILFKAGAVDEQSDSVGIAHVLEHMLFKGTETIGTTDFSAEKPLLDAIERIGSDLDRERARDGGADERRIAELETELAGLREKARQFILPNEYESYYTRHGARGFNAATSKDYTLYMVELPSNKIELWARLESDRLMNYVLREFYTERQAVLEERRLRVDTNPIGLLSERFLRAAFQVHPYGESIIGLPEDIMQLSVEKADRFYRRHYTPENGVIILVGDIDPDEIIPMLERYFGRIPPSKPARSSIAAEPVQREGRRVEVEFDAEPFIMIGYHKPALHHDDSYVFDMMSSILSGGRTSRLYRSLVQTGIALSANSFNGHPGERFGNLFMFTAAPRAPHTVEDVEEAINGEIERLKREPVTQEEFDRVLKQVDAAFIRALQSNRGMAYWLASSEATAGSWRYLLTWRDRIHEVTPDDVIRVARTYLRDENRTVGTLVKPER